MAFETTIIERIKMMIRNEEKSVEAFSKITGISKYTLDSMFKKETNPSFENLNKIISVYAQYSLDWLLTGKGEMLKVKAYDDVDPRTNVISLPKELYFVTRGNVQYAEMPNGKFHIRVPFISVKSYSKYIDECCSASFIGNLETADFIVDKVEAGQYFAFEVKGDSMDDNSKRSICSKDIVLVRKLEKVCWSSKLDSNGYPFWIIVLDNAIVCKQIIEYDASCGEIVCHSLNLSPEYADFRLPLDNVRQLYSIVAKQTAEMF